MARPPLTRDAVVAAAIALAGEDGLDRLSMRRLGERLGVEAMSLYHHVRGKPALLDAMVDAVFAEIDLPRPGEPLRDGLRRRAVSQRAVLHRHRWALGLLESRSHPGPATLAHHDAVLGFLYAAGWGSASVGHAYALLDAYVYGFVLQEQQLPIEPATAGETAAAMVASQPDLELPHLARFVAEVVARPGYDFAAEFEVGLALVLDAVTSLAPSAATGA